MIDRVPYTYLLEWDTGHRYYGVRFAKGCDPSDLWNPYKSSSLTVKDVCNIIGNPLKIEVRRTFDSIEAARKWETKVLKKMNVVGREDYLNKTDNISIEPAFAAIGGRTPKTEQMKRNLSATKKRLGQNFTKDQRRLAEIGKRNGKYAPGISRPDHSLKMMGNKCRSGCKDSEETKRRKSEAIKAYFLRKQTNSISE